MNIYYVQQTNCINRVEYVGMIYRSTYAIVYHFCPYIYYEYTIIYRERNYCVQHNALKFHIQTHGLLPSIHPFIHSSIQMHFTLYINVILKIVYICIYFLGFFFHGINYAIILFRQIVEQYLWNV